MNGDKKVEGNRWIVKRERKERIINERKKERKMKRR